jgi:hypothetical protein
MARAGLSPPMWAKTPPVMPMMTLNSSPQVSQTWQSDVRRRCVVGRVGCLRVSGAPMLGERPADLTGHGGQVCPSTWLSWSVQRTRTAATHRRRLAVSACRNRLIAVDPGREQVIASGGEQHGHGRPRLLCRFTPAWGSGTRCANGGIRVHQIGHHTIDDRHASLRKCR